MISLFYPIVQFKYNDNKNPVNVIYKERFYQISRYSNRIDTLYLQKNIFIDDYGWFTNKYNETSYWGLNEIYGDSYTNGNQKDLMNEGSTSRVYSFNIYIEPSINEFFRIYKKKYIIISECISLIYFVSFIFHLISKFCKYHSINKKFLEFLFVNLKGKTDIFDKKVKQLKELNGNSLNKIDNNNFLNYSFKKINKCLLINNSEKKDNFRNITNLPSQKNNIIYNKAQQPIDKKKEISLKDNSVEMMNNDKPKELLSNKSNDYKEYKNVGRPTIKSHLYLNKRKGQSPLNKERFNKSGKNKRKMSFVDNSQICIQSLLKQFPKNPNNNSSQKKLFPSRYYFYVLFIKNLDVLNKTKCLSKKFSRTYMFLSRLLDIYSYFDLIRQFNIFKTCFLKENNLNVIEKTKKINIGEISFMKNIKECFDNNNFRIFGQMNIEQK